MYEVAWPNTDTAHEICKSKEILYPLFVCVWACVSCAHAWASWSGAPVNGSHVTRRASHRISSSVNSQRPVFVVQSSLRSILTTKERRFRHRKGCSSAVDSISSACANGCPLLCSHRWVTEWPVIRLYTHRWHTIPETGFSENNNF